MTYSIVARDPETGQLGVAVKTCMFAVGRSVPWARAGVGAVASQAMTDPAYGPRCLDALERGAPASDALAAARAADDGAALRQVGVVDASGRAAAFTGELCIDCAGHHIGDGYAVQANMMASAAVWPAMGRAFERATGPLSERLLAALDAAEAEGGDARGRMSAAIVVVDGEPARSPGGGIVCDLRVDHHDRPLVELRRLMRVAGAYAAYNRAVDALFAGDATTALEESVPARRALPDDENVRFLHAGALAFAGRVDDATTELRALVDKRPTWATIIRGFVTKGLLVLPPGFDLDAVAPTRD